MPQPVRIADAVAEVFGRVVASAKSKGIGLDTTIDRDADVVYADRTALEQILLNLVENALRHTGDKGRITVATTPAENGVDLIVSDTGTGIPPEHLPGIFRALLPRRQRQVSRSGATGLGLAMVKHLVEAHGGSVWAESALGAGTTIRIFFPDGTDIV